VDPDIKDIKAFIHVFRHGVQDANSSAYEDIKQGDRLVTEPDDIVKMEEEVAKLHRQRIEKNAAIEERKRNFENDPSAFVPGVFRWFEDDSENLIDNTTNLTYGTWVWCRNESSFGSLHWRNGSIPGAPVMKPHQKFFTIAKCVSVDGPGLLDDEEESEEEEKAKDMEQEEHDEMVELQKRNWVCRSACLPLFLPPRPSSPHTTPVCV